MAPEKRRDIVRILSKFQSLYIGSDSLEKEFKPIFQFVEVQPTRDPINKGQPDEYSSDPMPYLMIYVLFTSSPAGKPKKHSYKLSRLKWKKEYSIQEELFLMLDKIKPQIKAYLKKIKKGENPTLPAMPIILRKYEKVK